MEITDTLKGDHLMEKAVTTEHIEVLTHSSIRIHRTCGTICIDPFRVGKAFNDADYFFSPLIYYILNSKIIISW